MTAPGRRDRKKQQTRAALITAALRLVDERGLERVTVEDISEAADVSPRTFFNYFASKDEAITGDQFMDSHGLRTRLLEAPREVPTISALFAALAPELAAMQRERELWLVRMRVLHANPSLVAGLVARSAEAERDLIAAVAERLGIAADSAFPQVAAAVTGAVLRTSMMRWAVSGGDRPLTDLVYEAFGMLAAGLADPTPEEVR